MWWEEGVWNVCICTKGLSLQKMYVDVVERIVVRPRGKGVCRIGIDPQGFDWFVYLAIRIIGLSRAYSRLPNQMVMKPNASLPLSPP